MEKINSYEHRASTDPRYKSLEEAYMLSTGRTPDPKLSNLDLARVVLEILDDPDYTQHIPRELAKDCVSDILQLRDATNKDLDKGAETIIRDLESGIAQRIYPKRLGRIDELTMDQIEYAEREDSK